MRFYEPTKRELKNYQKWVAGRPAVVREIAERLDPFSIYRLKPTGQYVGLESISDNGTITVSVHATAGGLPSPIIFHVFGIDPDDLVICDDISDVERWFQ